MKVDKVILSSNCDPFYLDFWPSISKIWKIKFGITPVLYLIHDDKNTRVSEEFGEVIYADPLPTIPIHIQTQCIRYWYPIKELETTWMTSDIDMYPISKKHFIYDISHVPDDKFINLNARKVGAFPCCYNIAKGSTFKEILKLTDSFEDYLRESKWEKFNFDHNNTNKHFLHWGIDESHANNLMMEYPDKNKFVLIGRHGLPPGHSGYRIDRPSFNWNDNEVLSEYYVDAHSIRPYSLHKNKIDRLVELILKG